ncbi:hypothetical protein E8E15_011562 [Penicillium rubens]|uniref:Uncharacterized protein n=2 Tax=Penicillium chrysogenum species complex TaxID=254878 RepID=B6H2C3_PENRW|nr:uncharacterized protein N7525_003681 [Penicillium rubens]KZN92719.1 hypothetical protein EN45_028800 [Penicillium chrysogenum]CAP91543.1 hypothetical protein PCH_Pc13g04740 [Penicillium rubens Wisconsin 54-1255]KAF3031021.1 hypothetical protein E8E15_011562 [Penicillium rubens]KAJ5045464.1 hypothetical protein NUH16_002281 [Penicillium rubens]KAJ5838493.1 hypothetical protein N7525_003681 [Penicillium rubens]
MDAAEEYAELMNVNKNEGKYLFYPQRFSRLHPGSVGFFNRHGVWSEITDLCEEGRPKRDGYENPSRPLKLDQPTESFWKTRSSGSEAEMNFGLTGGLSGALSAAPVDVSAEAKNKSGSSGQAALITESAVRHETLEAPFQGPIQKWVEKNAKALVDSDYGEDVATYGLWAIQAAWVTKECAITLNSAKNREANLGFDVGATGLGKVGASGGSLAKLEQKGWTAYEAKEGDQGLVIAFGGFKYELHKFFKWRSNPLKITDTRMDERPETIQVTPLFTKPILDENGVETGFEIFKHILNENGEKIGEEKVDIGVQGKEGEGNERRDAEREKEEQERQEKPEEKEDSMIQCDTVGISETALEADSKAKQA